MKKSISTLLPILLFVVSCAAPQKSTSNQLTPTSQKMPTERLQVTQPSSPTTISIVSVVAPTLPMAGDELGFESLDMSDANTGWSIDVLGRIFHTTDGGDAWRLASPPDGAYTSNGFFALDGNIAWAAKDVPVRCWDYWGIYQCDQPYYAAVKDGMVWKTTNGGQTWQPSDVFPLNVEKASYSFGGALPFSPMGLQFIDPQTGWLLVAVGQTPAGEQSLLYRTSDGGTTWELAQTFGFESGTYSCPKRGFAFRDENNGWLVANCPAEESDTFPMVLHTTDGGNTWSLDSQIQGISIPGDLRVFQPSLNAESLQRYPDGSLGTHLLHYFSDTPILVFFRIRKETVDNWVSGTKFYQASTDQSGGWMTMGSEFFLDADHGWRLYWDLFTNGRWLQETADGGKTWESIKAVAWRTARFEFVDAQTGWAIVVDQAGLPSLVKTTDGGQTWNLLAARVEGGETSTDGNPPIASAQDAQPVNLSAIWMIDSLAGWAMTDSGEHFLPAKDGGYKVMYNNQLLRTIDGAQTWSNVTPPAEYKAYQDRCFSEIVSIYGGLKPDGFFALDADNAWVAQHGCAPASIAVWKTSDGGQSWRKIPISEIPVQPDIMPAFFSPISLSFDDAAHGWLAADLYAGNRSFEGFLFRTQDGGDSWQLVSNESLPCYPYCAGVTFRSSGTLWLADDPRPTPAESDYLFFSYSDDGGSTWKQRALFDTTPIMPSEFAYSSRIHMPNWEDGFYCGSTRLGRFSTETIGANSDCYDASRSFFVSYLTLIDNNNQLKTTIDGLVAWAEMGDYYGQGGWLTNQSESFYNRQLGWRLYTGTGTDANGPVYFQHTRNGGDTWETLAPVPWQNARFQFLDPQNGWALVTLPWGKALVKTTDGGQTWEEISPVMENH